MTAIDMRMLRWISDSTLKYKQEMSIFVKIVIGKLCGAK